MDSHTIVPHSPDASAVAEKSSHYVNVLKGFELLALAATFTAAVQAQIMTSTIGIGRDAETTALTAVNSLFFAGFAFCITSALLAFLTARWLQCLTTPERCHFEIAFAAHERLRSQRSHTSSRLRDVEEGSARSSSDSRKSLSKEDEHPFITPRLVHAFFAHTLFIPMDLLVVGFLCMSIGLLVFAWADHSLAVGIVVTVVYLILLPFPIGVFMIGRNPETRLAVIHALSKRQGDW